MGIFMSSVDAQPACVSVSHKACSAQRLTDCSAVGVPAVGHDVGAKNQAQALWTNS